MIGILNVAEKPLIDESIIKKEYHTYLPYLQSFKNGDEIRIAIQNQDLYVLPSESLLYIEGNIRGYKQNDVVEVTKNIKLKNNAMAFLFDDIRYEINGLEVDKTRHLGITSTIKNYVSQTDSESKKLKNAGWSQNDIALTDGYFNFCVPLKMLLGFAEDFNKIIVNSKHELILTRSKTDDDVIYSSDAEIGNLTLSLTNLSWKVPHVQLADFAKLQLFKIIKSGQSLSLMFRSWDCHFNPALTQTTNNIWNVKLTSNNERPRFILIVFYDNNNKKFIHCQLSDVKVHLNSTTYPYDDLNLNFQKGRYAMLYEMYCKFQEGYYLRNPPQPLLSLEDFMREAPIIVMDVTHQNEGIKTGSMDIKIEFRTNKNVPENTAAYCILIQDRVIEYVPLTGEIKKIV